MKKGTIYTCASCGYTQPRWLGRCPECGAWNSFTENAVLPKGLQTTGVTGITGGAKPELLCDVDPMEGARLVTGISEFDRVLGGGAMIRSAILAGGEPGIGKSTMLMQVSAAVAHSCHVPVLYVSGEESASQIRARADRLGLPVEGITILCTSRLEDVNSAIEEVNPVFVVIDSIQTVYTPDAGLVPGTINQLKYCAQDLITWVKEHDAVLCMTAHVTKEGLIAGPKALEHMVDTVISFERSGDDVRFLRSQKNRFGSVDELGIFSMGDKGLLPVEDPSAMFITRRSGALPAGVAAAPVFEGSRVFLVEIQALTVGAKASLSRVYSDKIESSRVSRVAAVLEKQTGLVFSDQDLYINVAGGVRLTESAIDLALSAALYSARTNVPLPKETAFVGELSLAGEIRPVTRLKQRVKTAAALGFTEVFAPLSEDSAEGVVSVVNMKELIAKVFA